MTVTEIAVQHGVSRQTIHTYRRTGIFPSPVEGEGSTRPRFREDEVAAFFKANPKQPRKKRRFPPERQGEPMDARKDLYAFAMQGKEHSPVNSEKASEKIDAFRAAVLSEAAQHLYTALFPAIYDDMGQKAAEGVNRAVSELRRMADEKPEA